MKTKENLTKHNNEIRKSITDADLGFSKEKNKDEEERDAATDLEVADLKNDVQKFARKSHATVHLGFEQKRQHRKRAGKRKRRQQQWKDTIPEELSVVQTTCCWVSRAKSPT